MLSQDSILNNRYRVERMHELGAAETIYLGWDILRDKPVIISETKAQPNLTPDDLKTLKDRFNQHAEALRNLNHSHLIPPSDGFIVDPKTGVELQNSEFEEPLPLSYIISPAIEYDSLINLITQQGALPEKRVMVWAEQVLRALTYCHQHNVLHGDIRPQNIYISPDGDAKLAHFEVPTLWHPSDPRRWTGKLVLGTPDYAPPEKWAMRIGQIDERSDLYSLGATLLHALTGRLPISAEERIANPYDFQDIQITNPKISSEVKSVIIKAMSVTMDKRYNSAADMAAALHSTASMRVYDVRPALPLLLPPPTSKRKILYKLLGLALSTIVLFSAVVIGLRLNRVIPPLNTWFKKIPDVTENITPIATPLSSVTEVILATNTIVPATSVPTEAPVKITDTPVYEFTTLISDTFDSNIYQWPITEHQDEWGTITRNVSEGAYVWEIGAEEDVGRWCLPDSDSYTDNFTLSVAGKRQSGPPNIAYGLIIRHNEGRYYVFSIRDDGYYRFSLWQGSEWITIIDWTETRAINSGAYNLLQVVTKNSEFEFYINDTYVANARDDEIAEGDNGLSVIVLSNPEIAVVEFDNFLLISDNPR